MNRLCCIALFVAIFSITAALADPPEVDVLEDIQPTYIALGASDIDAFYMEDGVAVLMAEADTNFTINISESYAEDIDNCWVYFDGAVYSLASDSIELSADDYRSYYGAVAIEYDDDTFEYAAFIVNPWWDPSETMITSVSAPAANSWILPTDVDSVFTDVNDIDPDGPSVALTRLACIRIGTVSGDCDTVHTTSGRSCSVDADCRNYQ